MGQGGKKTKTAAKTWGQQDENHAGIACSSCGKWGIVSLCRSCFGKRQRDAERQRAKAAAVKKKKRVGLQRAGERRAVTVKATPAPGRLCLACKTNAAPVTNAYCATCKKPRNIPVRECADKSCGRRHRSGLRWCEPCLGRRAQINVEAASRRGASATGADRTDARPGLLYLVYHPRWRIAKVGICFADSRRVEQHEQHGWRRARIVEFETLDRARRAEAAVIVSWRRRGWKPVMEGTTAYWAWRDSAGGATETVSLADVGYIQELVIRVEGICGIDRG
jgi:hypothetical protein